VLMFKAHVKPPVGKDMERVMNEYARLGFAGAVGSVDCTHVFWDKCPESIFHLCKGKHAWPSLVFEAVVDHSWRIHSCTEAFYGATADPTVAAADPYVSSILDGRHAHLEYSLYTKDGGYTTVQGGYLIADNGYPNSWMYAKPEKHRFDAKGVYWSEFLESIRKDVERTFGIVKKRFMFVKNPNQYHSQLVIQQGMWAACALHNMILDYDEAYNNVDWAVLDAADAGDEIALGRERDGDIYETEDWVPEKAPPGSGMGIIPATLGAPVRTYDPRKYEELEELLMDHFKYSFERGSVVWSQGFSVNRRLHFPMRKKSKLDVHNCLYRAPSTLLGKSEDGLYNIDIGMGLFSTRGYKKGELIAMFIGDTHATVADYDAHILLHPEESGYCVLERGGQCTDCYRYRNQCYASMANCHRGARTRSGRKLRPNCTPRAHGGKMWLIADIGIGRYSEIIWDYGEGYKYRTTPAQPMTMTMINTIG
jgi:hypothetical protein